MKKFDKVKGYSYSMHLDKNISYGKAMPYKLTVDEFEWDETSNLQTKSSKIEKTLIFILFIYLFNNIYTGSKYQLQKLFFLQSPV